MNTLMAKFCGVPALQPKKRTATRYKIDWEKLGPKIRELAPTMNISQIADELGVCDKTVSRYLAEHNLRPHRGNYRGKAGQSPYWTADDDKFLLAHLDRRIAWIAKHLDRSQTAVRHRLALLRSKGYDASCSRSWTEEELDIIRNNLDMPITKLGELITTRTLQSIKHKRARLKCLDESQG